MGGHRLDYFGWGHGQVVDSCEHDSEMSGFRESVWQAFSFSNRTCSMELLKLVIVQHPKRNVERWKRLWLCVWTLYSKECGCVCITDSTHAGNLYVY